jgi:hypothetical protein
MDYRILMDIRCMDGFGWILDDGGSTVQHLDDLV